MYACRHIHTSIFTSHSTKCYFVRQNIYIGDVYCAHLPCRHNTHSYTSISPIDQLNIHILGTMCTVNCYMDCWVRINVWLCMCWYFFSSYLFAAWRLTFFYICLLEDFFFCPIFCDNINSTIKPHHSKWIWCNPLF